MLLIFFLGIIFFLFRRISLLKISESQSRSLVEKIQLKNDIRKQNGAIHHTDQSETILDNKKSINGNITSSRSPTNSFRHEDIAQVVDTHTTNCLRRGPRGSDDDASTRKFLRTDTAPSFCHGSGDLSPCSDKQSSTTESDATCQSRTNSFHYNTTSRLPLLKAESIREGSLSRNHGSPIPLRLTGTLVTPGRKAKDNHISSINPNSQHFPLNRPINFSSVKETDLTDECHNIRSVTPLLYTKNNSPFHR